jgi:hypothetical protein
MLTADGFDRLLAVLDSDRTRAALAYEQLRTRLVGLLRWWGAANSEELADRTLDRVARKLEEGVDIPDGSLGAYVRGVARKVFYEAGREARAERDAQAEAASQRAAPGDDDAERFLGCMDACLGDWSAADRQLMLRYYGEGKKEDVRRQLAQELGVTPTALRIRTCRLRERLAREMSARLAAR